MDKMASPSAASPNAASPTAVSPNAASPTAASPTPSATASPTAASPTAASPNAASPTAASPTAASPTAASPTAASPNAASPTAASPTAASPTAASPTAALATASATEKKKDWVSYLCLPFEWIAYGLAALAGLLIALGAIAVGIFYILFRIFGASVFLFLVPRPHVVHTTVDSVSLAQLSLSPNTTLLQYNITLATTIHNPNKRINLYFHEVESMTLFDGKRFGYAQLPDFYQRTRSSTQLTLAFQGQQPIEGNTAANYKQQQAGGVFSVDVKLNGKIGKKVWLIPEVKGPEVRMTCKLSLPANGTASDTFKPTDCKVSYCIFCR